ncbi:MAG: helix-turn-helix protein [Rhizobium sp.]|nr:helix-turn-helix protein [Rhizobium sp.]
MSKPLNPKKSFGKDVPANGNLIAADQEIEFTGMADRQTPGLGSRLKSLRRRLSLTITQVSQMTGLAVSTISKAENEQMSLTYDKIVQMASGLGLDISDFFTDSVSQQVMGRRSVTLPGNGVKLLTAGYGYEFPCAELSGKKMVPIVADVLASSLEEHGPLHSHSGEEYLYVLEGEVIFISEFYKPLSLTTGASIYFDAKMGHAFIRSGAGGARVLSVCTAPENELADLGRRRSLRVSLP